MLIDSENISYSDARSLAMKFKRLINTIPAGVKVIITSYDIQICDAAILEEYAETNPDLGGDTPIITSERFSLDKVIGYENQI